MIVGNSTMDADLFNILSRPQRKRLATGARRHRKHEALVLNTMSVSLLSQRNGPEGGSLFLDRWPTTGERSGEETMLNADRKTVFLWPETQPPWTAHMQPNSDSEPVSQLFGTIHAGFSLRQRQHQFSVQVKTVH